MAAVLHLDRAAVHKHLRTAARGFELTLPPPAAADPEVREACAPLLEAARQPAGREPSTRCPEPEVLDALAAGDLDGPLLLAEADHVADCAPCLARVVKARGAGAPPTPAPPRKSSPVPLVIGAVLGATTALLYLLYRAR